MKSTSDNSYGLYIYQAADILGIPLHKVGNRWRGAQPTTLRVGPLSFKAELTACSDECSDGCVSFLAKSSGDLWLYLVVGWDVKKQAPTPLLYVLDGGAAGLHMADISHYGTGTAKGTVAKFAAAQRAVFTYTDSWKELHATAVD